MTRYQDDFYDAINGEWEKTAVIPADKSRTGGFIDLDEEIEELMFAYHKKFKDYVDEIISVIIPEGYLETKVDFETAINEIAKMNKSAE